MTSDPCLIPVCVVVVEVHDLSGEATDFCCSTFQLGKC
jgi:hypothetical protein